ncbi:hypothetical protein NQ318_017007 [Aromia moschata]|uniref:Uncharacterized protein n=1 Tax=Aromia moschata TaxID=1265417 RepID=A0AAV8YE34_9CUCU|nr:hypothetical protein NQ318_017007 [Aromia moschata]
MEFGYVDVECTSILDSPLIRLCMRSVLAKGSSSSTSTSIVNGSVKPCKPPKRRTRLVNNRAQTITDVSLNKGVARKQVYKFSNETGNVAPDLSTLRSSQRLEGRET